MRVSASGCGVGDTFVWTLSSVSRSTRHQQSGSKTQCLKREMMFVLLSVAVLGHALEAQRHVVHVLVIKLEKPSGLLGVYILNP